jgi:hypothetical protein
LNELTSGTKLLLIPKYENEKKKKKKKNKKKKNNQTNKHRLLNPVNAHGFRIPRDSVTGFPQKRRKSNYESINEYPSNGG